MVLQRRTADCRILVQGLERLIKEASSSRLYVDKDGVPIMRSHAKTTLRKIT